MAISPLDDALFTGFAGAGYIVSRVDDGRELRTTEFSGSSLAKSAISKDGQVLAYGCAMGSISLYDAKTDKPLGKFVTKEKDYFNAHFGRVQALAFDPAGKFLASAADGDEDFSIRVWDVEKREQVYKLTDQRNYVQSLAFSPDGAYLASASKDARVRVYDVAAGFKLLHTLAHGGDWVHEVAFAKDGTLASASDDKSVRLWDARRGKELKKLVFEDANPQRIAFSPTEDLLAIACDSKIVFWHHKTGKQHEIPRTPGIKDNVELTSDDDTGERPADPKPAEKPSTP